MVTKGFASCNTLISDWPKIHSPQPIMVSEYLGHCILNNIKILKFLADRILLNTKLYSEVSRKSFIKILFYFQSIFEKNQVELKN